MIYIIVKIFSKGRHKLVFLGAAELMLSPLASLQALWGAGEGVS